MKYDCLIVDDEEMLANSTKDYFNLFEVKTYSVNSYKECMEFLKENEAELILLDINLKDGLGFNLCKELRTSTSIPIIFISARNTDDDKIIALNIGGDDYVEKPYSLGVLLAKVKAVLKRFKKDEAKCFNDGHLKIDYINKEVYVDNKLVKLTSIEYKLLIYLANNSKRLVSKDELFINVWQDKFTQDGTLNVHIRKIREAIELDPNNPKYIITVWKEGYRFEGESK
ncbi:MAG: response regulator transcription factor [Acholeplasmatales bacterium]|nr:response regulator transcription factor [Acholeplasmatales bacterium]